MNVPLTKNKLDDLVENAVAAALYSASKHVRAQIGIWGEWPIDIVLVRIADTISSVDMLRVVQDGIRGAK